MEKPDLKPFLMALESAAPWAATPRCRRFGARGWSRSRTSPPTRTRRCGPGAAGGTSAACTRRRPRPGCSGSRPWCSSTRSRPSRSGQVRRLKSRVVLAVLVAASVPAVVAIGMQRAVRHTAVTCFGKQVEWIDIGSASVPDWGAISRWRPDQHRRGHQHPLLPGDAGRTHRPGTPLENVKILYATREIFTPGPSVPPPRSSIRPSPAARSP